VVAGKYRLGHVLGRGGMGVVIAARHLQLDAPVALKFMIAGSWGSDSTDSKRFLLEAKAVARLRGEHVARIMDLGELETGSPYLVMEYLEGCDLSSLIRKSGCPPVDVATEYLVQTCEALEEAHTAGIVHRDIKPSNLFLTRRPNGTPCIKVLDFGISKQLRSEIESGALDLTSTLAVLGSPLYMSPEQLRASRDVDARADVWSLGVTAYQLLCGVAPFEAASVPDLCFRIAQDAPASLRQRRPEVPEGLESVVLRCLEKNRDDRYPSARALSDALAPFAARSQGRTTTPTAEPPEPSPRPADVAPSEVALVATLRAESKTGDVAASWGATAPESRHAPSPAPRVRTGAWILAAAGVGAGVASAWLAIHARTHAPVDAPAMTAAAAPSAAIETPVNRAPSEAPSHAVDPPTVDVARTPVAALAVVAAASSRPPAAPSGAPARAVAKGAPSAPGSATLPGASLKAPARKANCNPPYVIDSDGDRQYKRECL
jgi:serine/threonine protein kinase